MNDNTVTRFAPSPTGYLHLGHAYSAILNAEYGNRFILRIEDIDNTRCKPEFETAINQDLAWLGLTWEQPVRRQSDRIAIYEAQLKTWHEDGLVYRCFKTRKDIESSVSAPHESAGVFQGASLDESEEKEKMEQGLPWAWRLSMDAVKKRLGPAFETLAYTENFEDGTGLVKQAQAWLHGDVVLGRKEIGTSYHLSCVMDDADQGITHVVRGTDLAAIAGLHTLLFHLLGHEAPVFRHHKLVTDANGKRLAKRDKSITLRALRAEGLSPADIRARLGLP